MASVWAEQRTHVLSALLMGMAAPATGASHGQPCKVERTLTRDVAAVQTRDAERRLLAYRWHPTTLNNWDGRLLIASGEDLDTGTGCERTVSFHLTCLLLSWPGLWQLEGGADAVGPQLPQAAPAQA